MIRKHLFFFIKWLWLVGLLLAGCQNEPSQVTEQATAVALATGTDAPRPDTPSPAPSPSPTPLPPTLTFTPLPTVTPTPTITPTPLPTEIPVTIEQNGAQMILVSGGFFRMGADSEQLFQECREFRTGCQRSWFQPSEPEHLVLLPSFYLDLYEVTNEAFLSFVNELVDYQMACQEQPCFNPDDSRIKVDENGNFLLSSSVSDYPVTGVSWYGAAAFCEWRGGRLPSEAEWEMAASWDGVNEVKTRYPWGDLFDGTLVNFCDVSCGESQAEAEVDDGAIFEVAGGLYPPGPAGTYDMAGNLWEWVADWFSEDYYSQSATADPAGPTAGSQRVVRGGSWFDTGNFTNVVIRFPAPPEATDSTIGFRCALDGPSN